MSGTSAYLVNMTFNKCTGCKAADSCDYMNMTNVTSTEAITTIGSGKLYASNFSASSIRGTCTKYSGWFKNGNCGDCDRKGCVKES